MPKKKEPAEKFNLQQHVTNQILTLMEGGVKPWERAWSKQGSDPMHCPVNLSSKKAYRGINVLLLWCAAIDGNYKSKYWVTYKQAEELGGNVKKGEKSTIVCYFTKFNPCKAHKPALKDCDKCDDIPMWRYYQVFNVEQCEGLTVPDVEPITHRFVEPIDAAEEILKSSGAVIQHQANLSAPCYMPGLDIIKLPHAIQFNSDEQYYATALHELTHWTGAEKRLNRTFGKRFGDDAYAFEELVAEMGSAFLCAEVGITSTLERHAGYLDHWVKILKSDKTAIFTAASKASDAYEYCLGFLACEQAEVA